MMGSRRTNEREELPISANPLIQTNSIAPNLQPAHSVTFQEPNVSAGHFDSVPYTPLQNNALDWENMYSMNQPITQGIPETSGNPMAFFMNPSSFQNPQVNLNSNTANTHLPEAPLLPEWNMRWGQQSLNQGHNAISAGGMNYGACISNFENPWSSKNSTIPRNFAGDLQMNRQGGELKFGPSVRPQVNEDILGSPLHYRPTIHTRNNVNFNTSQCGVQGKAEGSFLSLGIGRTEEALPSSHPGTREISDKLKEAASAELKMARARKAMGQTLDANFMSFQRNTSGFSNQFGHVNQTTSTSNEAGVHCTPNSVPGSSPYHVIQMQQNNMQHGISRHDDGNSNCLSSRNISYGDLNRYRAFVGNQAMHSGTSAQIFNQQYGLDRAAPESAKPSWTMSNTRSGQQLQNIRFKTANSLPSTMNPPSLGLGSSSTRQNYTGKHLLSQNHMSSQVSGGSLFTQRTAMPQVSWVNSGQSLTDLPFPKRLGVEFNGKDSPQAAILQTSSTTDSVIQPSKDPRTSVKSDFHVRTNHKRAAVAPPHAPHWVQRQKLTHPHPTIHHSKPIPNAIVHPSIPNIKPRIPATTAPIVSHITWKDPDVTPPELTRYKCLLCKRDLSLTSEGAVYQPTVPPAVAVLPCGHTFHDQCLQNITPQDQAKDPPCIPCAIGEN